MTVARPDRELVENRGNAPRTACLQGEPEPLLVPLGCRPGGRTRLNAAYETAWITNRSACINRGEKKLEDHPGHDPGTCGLRNRRSAH